MFAPLSRFLRQQRARQQEHTDRLTLENCGLSCEQIAAGERALHLLGLHADALQRGECLDVLYAVGINPTTDVLDSKLRQLRLHQQDALTWGQLAHVWHLLDVEPIDEEAILQNAFHFFDRDGNGSISVAELQHTMAELGNLLLPEEIAAFVGAMDANADGVIEFDEFMATLRSEVAGLIELQQQPGHSGPGVRQAAPAAGAVS